MGNHRFDLYMEMLQGIPSPKSRARTSRRGRQPQITLPDHAFIPAEWITESRRGRCGPMRAAAACGGKGELLELRRRLDSTATAPLPGAGERLAAS